MAYNRAKGLIALALAAAAIPAAPVAAHHSSSQFDMLRRLQVTGTVRRFQWTNPHVRLFLEVMKDGQPELWAFEGNSPNVLIRSGWHSNLVEPGQKIVVTSSPARDGRKIGLLSAVKLPNGRALSGFPVEGDGGPGGLGIGGKGAPPPPPITIYN